MKENLINTEKKSEYQESDEKIITRTFYIRPTINWYEFLFFIAISIVIVFLTVLFCVWVYSKMNFL